MIPANLFRFFCFILAILLVFSACGVTSPRLYPQNTDSHSEIKQQIDHLSYQAQGYLDSGKIKSAHALLDKALFLAKKNPDDTQLSLIYGQLSDAYLLHKQLQLSLQYAEKALVSAKQTDSVEAQATSLNYLGNSLFSLKDYLKAETAYNDAISLLENESLLSLRATLLINLSYLYLADNQIKQAKTRVLAAIPLVQRLPASKQQVYNLIATGYITLQLANFDKKSQQGLIHKSLEVFKLVLTNSKSLNFIAGLSYANGHLGELYLSTQQTEIAETLLNRALFFAAQNTSPELTARWQWQLARLKQQQGNTEQAQKLYTQALSHLNSIQSALVYGHRGKTNNDIAQQIYTDYIGHLLQQAAENDDQNQSRLLLQKARDVVENANSNELTNYFQDECVEAQRKKNIALSINDRIQAGVAVLYTLVFPDRVVLLLNLADGEISQFSVPVSNVQLVAITSLFRGEISQHGNPRKIRQRGQQLYNLLIQPIQKTLDKYRIETLVIAPTGILRTLPFAALHDGQHYLINNFALTISPGLKLTSRSSLPSHFEKRVLLNGLSESVEGFTALPFVEEEMNRIKPIYESTLLMNEDFRYQDIENQLQNNTYSAIVFATHSQFNQNVNQSYLISYDGKINFNKLNSLIKLNQFHEPPINLLVLSACETAIGDEGAALGMAGAAVKAGVGSVVASLWLVNDASTATLIPTFFEYLKDSLVSKAKALQYAQTSMIKENHYQHPFHWAGFLLIGNWQ